MSLKTIIPSLTEKLKSQTSQVQAVRYNSNVNRDTNEIYEETLYIVRHRYKKYSDFKYIAVYEDQIHITFYPKDLTYDVEMSIEFERKNFRKRNFSSKRVIGSNGICRRYSIYGYDLHTTDVNKAREAVINYCPKEYVAIFDEIQKLIDDDNNRIAREYLWHPDRVASILSIYNLDWYLHDWETTHINDPDKLLQNSDKFSDHIIQNLFNEECPIDSLLNMYKRVHGYRF